jgi:hypothetical protein
MTKDGKVALAMAIPSGLGLILAFWALARERRLSEI